MTLVDLKLELERLGVPARAYSLGRDQDERYCLLYEADAWHGGPERESPKPSLSVGRMKARLTDGTSTCHEWHRR
jgi:hypothetical protein